MPISHWLEHLETTLRPKGALIMPKKKAVDATKLIEMVKSGTSQTEIMKKMGFKTSRSSRLPI